MSSFFYRVVSSLSFGDADSGYASAVSAEDAPSTPSAVNQGQERRAVAPSYYENVLGKQVKDLQTFILVPELGRDGRDENPDLPDSPHTLENAENIERNSMLRGGQ